MDTLGVRLCHSRYRVRVNEPQMRLKKVRLRLVHYLALLYIFFLIWLMAFFSSRETWAWLMPTSSATCICVFPS